ncbi:MAG: ankyrin repeat domain-containing protein [Terriglobia bacterium]
MVPPPEAGADVNAKDKDGKTALMMATRTGHTTVVQLLKKAGAKE